ncbi:MAG: Crp/Fnr family transcriptional regulator [Chloroflexi bacterium]|nr:Crp/Fnr family transcriptional regulator [Chloroflexota bacterium]
MQNVPALIERMKRLPHFQNLSDADLETIIQAGKTRRVKVDVTLFREEEPCAGLYVLLAGQVQLHKLSPEGRDNIMAVVEPVGMFNEVAVLDGGVNPATAVISQNATFWHISRDAFHDLLEQYPQIGLGLLPILAARNRWLVSKYEDLSFRNVRARTAKLLLELSEYGRHDINRQQHNISTLAAQTCTVPEAISRALAYFRDEGLITSDRSQIAVHQPDKLARLAQIEIELLWGKPPS